MHKTQIDVKIILKTITFDKKFHGSVFICHWQKPLQFTSLLAFVRGDVLFKVNYVFLHVITLVTDQDIVEMKWILNWNLLFEPIRPPLFLNSNYPEEINDK